MDRSDYLVDSHWPKHCPVCGVQHFESQFNELELVSWRHQKSQRGPKGVTLELRRCPCGSVLEHTEFDVFEHSFGSIGEDLGEGI